jgi:hypothetical protein
VTGIVDTVDISVEVWGGLVTNLAPSDLPHGASPDNQDCQFQIGSVRTRPGITSSYTLPGLPFINYLKTYETLNEVPRLLSLDTNGVLRKDVNPGGALTTISSSIIGGSACRSDNLFGREYMAFGNGTNGLDIPRQFDDTNFDRVSQVGPGSAPQVADFTSTYNINAVLGAVPFSYNIASISETGFVATAVIAGVVEPTTRIGDTVKIAGVVASASYNGTFIISAVNFLNNSISYILAVSGLAAGGFAGTAGTSIVAVHVGTPPNVNFPVGMSVAIAGVTNAAYNGTFPVRAVTATDTFEVSIPATAGQASSGNGTATLVGNIPAGKHQITVIFVTRSGYYTKPAPPVTWNSAGNLPCLAAAIPIGPPNVVARVLSFAAVNQSSFYHLGPLGLTIAQSNMYIPDNTTTSLVVDFSDQVLLLGTLDDPLFNQIELPPVAGTIGYSSRLFHWGEQDNLGVGKEAAMLNLTFDGGFTNLTSAITGTPPNFPLGWTPDLNSSAGGGSANVGGRAVIFGDAYTITGNGATAIRGKITQGTAVNYLGNPILLPNVNYGVRARLAVVGTPPAAGTVHINLQSTIGGFTTPGLSVAFGLLTGTYMNVSGLLTAGLATINTDLVLQLYVDGTPTNGSVFLIDNIEIYPLNAQFNNSAIRASFAQLPTQGQESYDAVSGLIEYNLNDGQSVRNMFKIRERLYIVKEHSFGVTQDDGVNEPDLWQLTDVSTKVGTPSLNGVGVGEDWVVIAHRTGLYLFWGGEVEKISQEIQPTWDSINWQFGSTIAVSVDLRHRRILVTAPFGASTIPNKTLVMDYHDVGADAAAIASNPPIHLTYTGTKKAFDRARKWSPWTISANSVAQIELASGQTATYFGSNDGTGNINVLDETGTVFTDNGATIPSFYTTAAFAELPTEDAKQLKSHRHLYTYLTMYVQGTGSIGITVFPDSLSNAIVLNSQPLVNPAFQDLQMMLNQSTERMFIKVASQGNGQNFDLQRMVLNMKPEPWSIIR